MAVVYHAYADESGIQTGLNAARFCVVAGYVGVPYQWQNYEATWRGILSRFGIDRFHAQQFFARHPDSPYGGWSDARRDELLRLLTDLLNNLDIIPIGSAIDVAAFNAMTLRQRRWFTGAHLTGSYPHFKWKSMGAPSKPYYAAFMHYIVKTARTVEADAIIHFHLDQQNVMEKWARRVFSHLRDVGFSTGEEHKLASIEYHNSKDRIELQAADLLAHGWYSYCMKGDDMTPDRLRVMQVLTRKGHMLELFDADTLPSAFTALTSEQRAFLAHVD